MRVSACVIFMILLLPACDTEAQGTISGYDFGKNGRHQVELNRLLREISGLTVTPHGHLLAHDDEKGVIYRIDAMTGSILSRFKLGRTTITEDFEDIASAGEMLYLVTSDGRLYVSREGNDGGRVEYNVLNTPLTRSNNVEGLCYDPESGALLMACKDSPGRGFSGKRTVYSYYPVPQRMDPSPRFVLDEKQLRPSIHGKQFKPSAIARHPLRKTFFILASDGCSLVEVDANGNLRGIQRLDRKLHPQPEGLTFLANGDMLISDEGTKHGTLTRYFYNKR
ncbi:MAG: SdiA-regulated domain-containing protein [Bacteroidetes bacterium]|nr:SdiA-regulated domain-containing protein [Bacteroidota bacterium]